MRYWTQFSFDEIKAMQGRDSDTDLCQDEVDTDLCQDEEERIDCCRRGCDKCLL